MNKKVVTVGGGTGSYTILSGLRQFSDLDLTAIVSMADNGGSTGKLRDELGVLPPGDVRQCLVALSQSPEVLRSLFTYRFDSGELKGHNFGNLFLSALEKVTGDFESAVGTASEVLSLSGQVLPVTIENINVWLTLSNGQTIYGEDAISQATFGHQVRDISLSPSPKINPQAVKAIKEADLIIIGPGNIYCSLLPNLIVPGMADVLAHTQGKVVYNVNLMAPHGHCPSWGVEDFVGTIESFLYPQTLDYVVYNTTRPAQELLDKYHEEGSFVNLDQESHFSHLKLIGQDLLAQEIIQISAHDPLKRTLIRHDPGKIAQVLYDLL